MPAAFVGHGSPMNALDDNPYTRAWRAFGASVPRPRAVLVVSAHWFIGGTAVTAMAKPRTIHDFYGFPQKLFEIEYPADGAPDVAREVADAVRPRWLGLDTDSWGLDHGTWSVLVHMFPAADVPVLQLSINALEDLDGHLELARRLAPLRERGILILGSGNVVHNLRRLDTRRPDFGFDWAHRFEDASREVMTTSPGDIASLQRHPDYAMAVPTPDHFIPLLYLAALADECGRPPTVLVDGFFAGGISMTSWMLDAGSTPVTGSGGAAPLPDDVPADETNT